MTVNLDNCNEVIAELMGWKIITHSSRMKRIILTQEGENLKLPTESLDTQILVWKKYDLVPNFDKMGDAWSCEMWLGSTNGKCFGVCTDKYIEKAAALAATKAILNMRCCSFFELI